jgi:hypothetical protein
MPSPESRMPFHCNEVLFSNDAVSWCVRPVTPSDIKMQWVQHVIPFSVCFSSLSSWITSTTFLLAQVHHNAVVSILYLSTDGNVCSSACCSNRTPEPARWPQYKHIVIDPGWELFSRANCLESSVRAHCINVTGMDMCSSNLFVTLLSLFFSLSADMWRRESGYRWLESLVPRADSVPRPACCWGHYRFGIQFQNSRSVPE